MHKGRLEAFSDGVIAVAITIMVLELKPPHGAGWPVLMDLMPTFLTYLLSFVFLGIYWANLHLLFWLTLIPFSTGWMGEKDNLKEPVPVAVYGAVLLLAAIAYTI